jgi:hypothetical protein
VSERKQSAFSIIQSVLLLIAIGMGTWVVRSVNDHGHEISECRWEIRRLNEKLEALTKTRWSVAAQMQYNAELNTLNATLKTPDVRRIANDNLP